MRHIMVLNAKGGCGKSTLATNIASYFANEGANVALADYDPQRSSLDWLDRRPDNRPEIVGVAAFEDGLRHCPRSADFCTKVLEDIHVAMVPGCGFGNDDCVRLSFATSMENIEEGLKRLGEYLAK